MHQECHSILNMAQSKMQKENLILLYIWIKHKDLYAIY